MMQSNHHPHTACTPVDKIGTKQNKESKGQPPQAARISTELRHQVINFAISHTMNSLCRASQLKFSGKNASVYRE